MQKPGPTSQVRYRRKQLSAEGAACGNSLPLYGAPSAQLNLGGIYPGASPLAIRSQALSLKRALPDGRATAPLVAAERSFISSGTKPDR